MKELLKFLQEQILFQLNTIYAIDGAVAPQLNMSNELDPMGQFAQDNKLNAPDLLLLTLALVPHVNPDFLTGIVGGIITNGGDLPLFGGIKLKNHRGTFPTGETAQFIIAGNDLEERLLFYKYLHEGSLLFNKGIIKLGPVPPGEPKLSGMLILDDEFIDLFITGRIQKPQLSASFPAQLIETDLGWDDLVLSKKVMDQIMEIQEWIDYNAVLFDTWNLKDKVKPGYRVLFYGPPGTGKTLTASLLGKYTKRDVFRVDLSLVVSKYIGETETNLSNLFDRAQDKDWILFFDEADAIFGKRTSVRDAHDKYANQEVSYLLQRIENHAGLVILASNFKGNMDTAFTRRFQSIVEYENPSIVEREKLWESNIPSELLNGEISLSKLSKGYELTGANIVNVVQYACLKTAVAGNKFISEKHLVEGIRKEYVKEGKMI